MTDYEDGPQGEVEVMREAVRAATRLASALPPGAPPTWRPLAFGTALGALLRDEYELEDEDEQQLAELMGACAEIALEQEEALTDITFSTLLDYELEAWIAIRNEEE